MAEERRILVTGATGYIGSRLIPRLLENGFAVRAMARSMSKIQTRVWAKDPRVECVEADVFDLKSLIQAAKGCHAAYYLVHSMLPGQSDFKSADQKAALNMRQAAADSGIQRLIYLGGLGEEGAGLSRHLASRAEVACILQNGPIPVTVLRAAMIIGSGSASFEILRYLVDRLPIMVTPRWLKTLNQPIAVDNVLIYLAELLNKPETAGQVYDIGGPDILTYHRLMDLYAEEAGLPRRRVIPVPILTPRLSSYWIHLVTPVPAAIAWPLAEGLRNPVVCREKKIESIIPQELLTCREAIRRALSHQKGGYVPSHWTDAGRLPPAAGSDPTDPSWSGGTLFEDHRTCNVNVAAPQLWQVIQQIGGPNGWYHADWLWGLRGLLDRLTGGVGLRRGRRSPTQLRVGDILDFWRVFDVQEFSCLVLYAEMKLPGRAMLEFKITENSASSCSLDLTAKFWPRGLGGILYWYFVLPLHAYVFSGMLKKIVKKAEASAVERLI